MTRKHDIRCENSKSKRCKCECKGEKHGIKSGVKAEIPIIRITGDKVYKGKIINNEPVVTVGNGIEQSRLDPAFDKIKHSPDGFEWGYGGSGPAQLAFALLYDVFYGTKEAEEIRHYYQDFKFDIIANFTQGKEWSLTSTSIINWVQKQGEKIVC